MPDNGEITDLNSKELEALHRRIIAALKRHEDARKARVDLLESRRRSNFRKDFEDLAKKVGIKLEF